MKIASKNTAAKHTFARGSAKMPRKLVEHGCPLEGWRRRRHHAAKSEERDDRHAQSEQPEDGEHAAPAEHVADHARDGRAEQVAGEADGEQPADRHLALIDGHQIAR